jgi:hypothetical protein
MMLHGQLDPTSGCERRQSAALSAFGDGPGTLVAGLQLREP